MAKTRLVIPLLNVPSTLFDIPKWYMANDTYLSQIADDDYATLHREAEDQYIEWLKARTICVNCDDPPTDGREEHARSMGVSLSFVFNAFSSGTPLILSKAAYVDKDPSTHHVLTVNLQNAPIPGPAVRTPFVLRELPDPEPLSNLFQVVRTVVIKNPTILVTLDRFNTSLIRSNPYDQIIDITISLESIVEASTEIKFRFSLCNAIVAEPDATKRRDLFDLFQTLYDARSSIVHGDIRSKSSMKKIDRSRQRMAEIHRVAVAAISYYLMYQFKERKTSWHDHVERLALGVENRVTD